MSPITSRWHLGPPTGKHLIPSQNIEVCMLDTTNKPVSITPSRFLQAFAAIVTESAILAQLTCNMHRNPINRTCVRYNMEPNEINCLCACATSRRWRPSVTSGRALRRLPRSQRTGTGDTQLPHLSRWARLSQQSRQSWPGCVAIDAWTGAE